MSEPNPLVSVVVPVYNVEKYLDRAVSSLLNQTYRNLEIILVDDGSPDRCPVICDEYASRDNRIRVIHQVNSGVSDARNAALDIITGDYVTFLDSDDYMARNAVDVMVSQIIEHNADVVCCGAYIVDSEEYIYNSFKCDSDIYTTGIDVAKRMLRDLFPHNFSWGKIFKRHLFNGVRYPSGRIYEDNATTYRAVCMADVVVCIKDCLYYYYRGREGNTTSELNTDKAAWSYYCGCINCREYLEFCGENDDFVDVRPDICKFLFCWSKLCIETAIKAGRLVYDEYCHKVKCILDQTGVKVPLRLKLILKFALVYYYIYPILGRHR